MSPLPWIGGKMANPQLENGYFRIANELAEALMRTNLSAYQGRILWAIFRKTYGFNKKEDWLSNSQLVELTGLWKQHIYRTLKELVGRNLVTKRGYKIAFNKDYQQWRELPKGVTSHSESPIGVTPSPKGVTGVTKRGVHKRRQYTKDTLRDSANPAVKEFLNHWSQAFKEKTGQDYFVNGGKDGNLIKKMLKSYSLERLKELGKVYFKSQTQFFQDSGYTIGFFFSCLNKIMLEAEKVKKTW
jgi:phage replication O-like protein O